MTIKERSLIETIYSKMSEFEDEDAIKEIHKFYYPFIFESLKRVIENFWPNGKKDIKIKIIEETIKQVKLELL